jgi:hypothetical protein
MPSVDTLGVALHTLSMRSRSQNVRYYYDAPNTGVAWTSARSVK